MESATETPYNWQKSSENNGSKQLMTVECEYKYMIKSASNGFGASYDGIQS